MKSNNYVVGLLAHVDSGKTTLAESMLYQSGIIRKPGRVDHRNTFFDTEEPERRRGITIFSKQAQLKIGSKEICLLDTPGHVDFSAEMERTLQILDYAILIVSGPDGVQGHTETLWSLLKRYQVPVFVFVNKMDQPGRQKAELMREIQGKLDAACIDFSCCGAENVDFCDVVAMCDEYLMNAFLEKNSLTDEEIGSAVRRRALFPCFFGAALRQEGVRELMKALNCYITDKEYTDAFGASVYKIRYDEQNTRLTYLKVTGGSLKVKSVVSSGEWNEKADQIRIYSGSQYKLVQEAKAGTICAVTGLTKTTPGAGIGVQADSLMPVLEPILTYRVLVPQNCDAHDLYTKLCTIEEEQPELHLVWDAQQGEIRIQVMGEIQIEVLQSQVAQRFHVEIALGDKSIVYKETIAEPVIGIGHFEPLRHYAEVHLLMEPLARGSGLEFATQCSEDLLEKNWQRLILTHLEEKKHRGVLTGGEITDMRISILTGKAHQKHTEGGDFRQATYRAVRNGLKKAQGILLEPVYEFSLELPQEFVGRAMTDLQQRHATMDSPMIEKGIALLKGTVPVVQLQGYQMEVQSYSRGRGRLSCLPIGYDRCHNTDEVIQTIAYDSERDTENPTGSVFCLHGAGFYVDWDKVVQYAHVDSRISMEKSQQETESEPGMRESRTMQEEPFISQEEIESIFAHTFGSLKKKRTRWSRTVAAADTQTDKIGQTASAPREKREDYLLVDGYNIIFAWEELRELSEASIDSARDKLMDILCNYQGYKNVQVILVFDAYKVHGGKGAVLEYHNIHVVYTKEAETADQYIEKVTNKIGQKHNVTVATSDRLEQMIVWGQGAKRLSAAGLWEEVSQINHQIREQIAANNISNTLHKPGILPKKI